MTRSQRMTCLVMLVLGTLGTLGARTACAESKFGKAWAEIHKILERNRGEEDRLQRYTDVLIAEARDDVAYYKRLRMGFEEFVAYWRRYVDEGAKLKETFKKYAELKALERKFGKEHSEWCKRTRADEKRLLEELESLLDGVRRDHGALAKSGEAVRRHRESVKKLAAAVRDYLENNRDLARLRNDRDQVMAFRDGLPAHPLLTGQRPPPNEMKRAIGTLRKNVGASVAGVEKTLQTAEKEFAHLLRGTDHPEFRELYRSHDATTGLLAKHLDEIRTRSRKLTDQRKGIEDRIKNRVPDRILRRDLADAIRTTKDLQKQIDAFHREMKGSVVAEALDLGWCVRYDASLKKLLPALSELDRGSSILLDLRRDLEALEKAAPGHLDQVAKEVTASGKLGKLKPAFEKLEREMKKGDEARRKLVYEAKRHFEKAKAFREKEPFAKTTAALERARAEWMKSEQDRWKRVYSLAAVKECFAGTDSDRYAQVLSELGAKDLDGLQAHVEEVIRSSARKLEREGILDARDIEMLSGQCKAARRLSKERNAELPRWVPEMERLLPRLKTSSAGAARVKQEVDEYVKAVDAFVRHARKNYDTSLRALETASSLEQLISHRDKIENWARQHREKLKVIQASLRPIESKLGHLGKLPRSGGGLLKPLIQAANGRAAAWKRELAVARKTLEDPMVRSMLRGID